MQNLRRILKQPMTLQMANGGGMPKNLRSVCLADGGMINPLNPGVAPTALPAATPAMSAPPGNDWQSQKNLANAQTGASSIVAGQARTNAQAQVAALTPKPALAPALATPALPVATPALPVATPALPAAAPLAAGMPAAPMPSLRPSTSMSSPGRNTYTSDAAPSTPVAGGPITRIGNSFSNVSPPNESSVYAPAFSLSMAKGGDLRTGHGGHVPGSGSGDKIPAKYEPGEFVVSNDMLDQAPGLREQLHGLRGQVLAAKGMTPEEADAKAVSGGTLRANTGAWMPENPRFPGGTPISQRGVFAMDAISQAGDAQRAFTAQQNAARTAAVAGEAAVKSAAEDVAAKAALNKASPIGAPPPVATPAAPGAPAAAAIPEPATTTMGRAKSAVGNGLRSAGNFVKQAGPAVVAGIGGAYAANAMRDLGSDSDSQNMPAGYVNGNAAAGQIPTDGARSADLRRPYNAFTDNEAGRQIGNTLNAVAPFTGGVGPALRGVGAGAKMATAAELGSAAAIGAAGGVQAGRGTPNAQPPASAPSGYKTPGADATMPGQDPGRFAPTLRSNAAPSEAAPTAPGMNPREVMAMNNRMADSMASERLASEEASRSMPGPKHSGNDWQTRNALRNMGVSASSIVGSNKERMQRQAAFQQAQGNDFAMMSGADPASIAAIKARADMAQNSTTRRGQDMTQQTTLRGQNMDYESKQNTSRASANAAVIKAQQEQKNWNATHAAGRDDAKNAEITAAQSRGFKSSENATRRLESLAVVDGKIDPARLSQVRALTNSIAPGFDQMDEANQNAAMQKVLSANRITEGANSLRDPGFLNYVGLGKDSPAASTLPDFEGADVDEIGFWEGLVRPKISRGDYAVTKNGRTQHIPRNAVSETELELMKNNGARLRN